MMLGLHSNQPVLTLHIEGEKLFSTRQGVQCVIDSGLPTVDPKLSTTIFQNEGAIQRLAIPLIIIYFASSFAHGNLLRRYRIGCASLVLILRITTLALPNSPYL